MRVLVLGAGFGGLEAMARLAEQLGDEVEISVIDRRDGFTFGFSKLDVIFGRTTAEHVLHPYRDIRHPAVRIVQAEITCIDPAAKRVVTDSGEFDADVLIVALGADLEPGATPGLLEAGYEFYSEAGAFAASDVIANFVGGRVVVAVTSTPFKCPPAPSETALLMHDFLVARGIRSSSSIDLVMPMPVPIPPSPAASKALRAAFADRGIGWHPEQLVRALDPGRSCAVFTDGSEIPYDLFLGVPAHRVPDVVLQSGLCTDGWIAVNPETLETRFPGVYAIGDVTSVGTPKAGVFAEGQAVVVADRIVASVRAGTSSPYDGRGACYIEFGGDQVAKVDMRFRSGEQPVGEFDLPTADLAAESVEFGRTRVRRWFGRDWQPF